MIPVLEMTFSDVAGDPWEGRATVRFNGEPSQPFPVREGMTTKQRAEIRWYIEQYMDLPEGGNATRAAAIEKELTAYGRALWDGLQSDVVSQWLGAVQAEEKGRLELRAQTTQDEIAFRTPWELMRVGGDDGHLLHQLGVNVVRRVTADLPRLKMPDTKDGLRVLTVVARPDDADFVDPRYTPEAILSALEELPQITVDFARPGTLKALTNALEVARQKGRSYHVVHFDGHGTTLPSEAGIGALCFEQDDGTLDLVRAPRFGDLMSGFNIPLVVLEACRTATKESFAQHTVAGDLLRNGVSTVLAMGHAVHVDMTRELMECFYDGLARGWPVGVSLKGALHIVHVSSLRRTRIAAGAPKVKIRDWFVPQLYQGGDDPRLLKRNSGHPKPREAAPLVGFPTGPRAGFQGRGYQLHRLERLLLANKAVVIHAPGGMGKTALAREAAHWWTRTGMFPHGAMFVSLEGNPSPDRLISVVGEALEGVDFHQIENKRKWLADELAQEKMLIVWDNYESVLPAFNGGRPTPPEFAELAAEWTRGSTRLLITCRDEQVGFDAKPFPLGELSTTDGLMLLTGFLETIFQIGPTRREEKHWTADHLEPIVRRIGGHPLALQLLASQIPLLGPQQVYHELSQLLIKIGRDSPEGRHRSLWASLDFSIRHLTDETRAALPCLALLAGGCLNNWPQMLVGLDGETWQLVWAELERTGLFRVEGPFFHPHPVLGELVPAPREGDAPAEPPSQRLGRSLALPDAPEAATILDITPEAEERFIGVITSFALYFNKQVRTPDARVALVMMAGSEVVVRRAIDRALATGQLDAASLMTESLKTCLERTSRGGEVAALMARLDEQMGSAEREIGPTAAAVAVHSAGERAAADPQAVVDELKRLLNQLAGVRGWDTRMARAYTLRMLGKVYLEFQRRPAVALEPLERAVGLYAELELEGETDPAHRAAALGDLTNAFMYHGRFDEALQVAEETLELDRGRNDQSAVARGEGRVAQILAAQGRHGEAERRYRAVLAAAEQAGDDEAVGTAWQGLGVLALDRDCPDEAVEPLTKALAAFERAKYEEGRMLVLNSLGNAAAARGNPDAALSWFQRSLELAEQLAHLEGQADARANRAIVLYRQAKAADDPEARRKLFNRAVAEERESLAVTQQLGRLDSVAVSHDNLADLLRLAGQLDEAEKHGRQALAIRRELNDPLLPETLRLLEEIATDRGDTAAADEYRRQKEAAEAEAEQRAGQEGVPKEVVVSLLRLAATARAEQVDPARARGMWASVAQEAPWLAAHLKALATGGARPDADVPPQFADLIQQAWDAADGS